MNMSDLVDLALEEAREPSEEVAPAPVNVQVQDFPPDDAGKKKGRSQYFTFTLNLGLDAEAAEARLATHIAGVEEAFSSEKISFYSGGHELAPTTGQHHVQGYFELRKGLQWSYATAKESSLFSGQPADRSLWLRSSVGSALQNQVYTQKTADVGRWSLVRGEFRNYGQGKDPGLNRALRRIDAGEPVGRVYRAEPDASARHYRFFREYRLATTEPRSWPMSVFYIFGPSGSGKSSLAHEFFPPNHENFWLTVPKAGRNVWWDGYDLHSTVVIDDWKPGYFGDGHVLFMQRLVDRYALQVPIHGGQVPFVARTLIFTSNTPPDQMDSQEYSGYPWDATNPLYHRVYLREPKWHLLPIGSYPSFQGVSPQLFSDDPLVLAARRKAQEACIEESVAMRAQAHRHISEFLAANRGDPPRVEVSDDVPERSEE
jgi:hypothetical protein